MVVILLVYTFSLIRAFFVVCKTFKLNYIRKKDHLLPVGPGIWFQNISYLVCSLLIIIGRKVFVQSLGVTQEYRKKKKEQKFDLQIQSTINQQFCENSLSLQFILFYFSNCFSNLVQEN